MTRSSIIRIGPAGWSYKDWEGIVYPSGTRTRPLEWLSTVFDTVEVNVTFYRPVAPTLSRAWCAQVSASADFRFTVKLWQRFTHERTAWPEPEEVRAFEHAIEPLAEAGRLGGVLAQFPWSFRRTRDNRVWLARVAKTFSSYPLAVELRHASWSRPEVLEDFAALKIAFCNIDQPVFRDSVTPSAEVTSPIGYVRLHGRNADDWFRADASRDDRYNYLYSGEELQPWIEKIRRISERAEEVYVITNNHYRGQAVVNAFELQHSLLGTCPQIPQHLIDHYPRLARLLDRKAGQG